jgi:DNA polymerase III sliding clamp (beta) subunit (PCNA family)
MRIEDTSVFLTKLEVRALVAHASDDETRLHINSVCFDLAEGAVVATDGHRLAKLNGGPKQPDKCQQLVPRDVVERAGKSVRKADAEIEFAFVRDGGCNIRVDGSETLARTVDARFPPYDQVIPGDAADPSAERIGFNPPYLADLCLVSKAAGNKPATFRVFCDGELDPAKATFESVAGRWTVVVMPCRI